jgi:predicted transcriptional regulator of viral defense system
LALVPDAEVTEHHSVAQACARVPNGVVCLLTALRFHNLGTQNPPDIWLAVDRKAALPCKLDDIWRFAKLQRMTRVRRPYLEAFAAL